MPNFPVTHFITPFSPSVALSTVPIWHLLVSLAWACNQPLLSHKTAPSIGAETMILTSGALPTSGAKHGAQEELHGDLREWVQTQFCFHLRTMWNTYNCPTLLQNVSSGPRFPLSPDPANCTILSNSEGDIYSVPAGIKWFILIKILKIMRTESYFRVTDGKLGFRRLSNLANITEPMSRKKRFKPLPDLTVTCGPSTPSPGHTRGKRAVSLTTTQTGGVPLGDATGTRWGRLKSRDPTEIGI